MAEHTPTPWKVYEDFGEATHKGIDQVGGISIICIGIGDDDCGIRGRTDQEALANAAFIVQCVNSHEALVKALEFLLDTKWKSVDKDNMEFEGRITCYQLEQARAALSAARGK